MWLLFQGLGLFPAFFGGHSTLTRRLSLMDACSGYESSYVAFFVWPNGTLESTDNFTSIPCKQNSIHSSPNTPANPDSATKLWQNYQPCLVLRIDVCYRYTAYEYANATSTTSLYDATEVCVTYLQSWTNYSAPSFNFNYTIPDPTLVEATNSNSGYVKQISDACIPFWDAQNSSNTVTDVYMARTQMTLYYWHDRDLNASWWKHFQSDPYTSQYMQWDEWGFEPTDANNFRCVTANNLYQVRTW